jgi:hypothetical protein
MLRSAASIFSVLEISFTLNIEAASYSEKSVTVYYITWCHMLEDHSFNIHRCANITLYNLIFIPTLHSTTFSVSVSELWLGNDEEWKCRGLINPLKTKRICFI